MNEEKTHTRLRSVKKAASLVERRKQKPSRWRPEPMVVVVEGQDCALIPLTQGKFAIVDLEVFEEMNKTTWHFQHTGYACARINYRAVGMHRILAKTPDGLLTDHINGNRLDNRRINLRHATFAENARNRTTQTRGKVGLKGVAFIDKPCIRPYTAFVSVNNKSIYLGCYHTPEEAHEAYSKAVIEFHGNFARTEYAL